MNPDEERESIIAYWRLLLTPPTPWTPILVRAQCQGDFDAAGLSPLWDHELFGQSGLWRAEGEA